MNTERIAELLEPFLRSPITVPDSDLRSPIHSNLPHPNSAGSPYSTVPNHSPTSISYSDPAKAGEESAILSPAQLQDISTYIDILLRWNARINLTAIRDPEDIVTRHFGESLFAARHLFPAPSSVFSTPHALKASDRCSTLVDIGSGAGFPGLPIKLWAPPIALTLIESNHKKAAFLREITRALTLTNVNVHNARAETLGANTFDVVTLRAVERFESILPTAAALVASSGRVALLIGASQQDQALASLARFTWSEAVPVPTSRARILLIGHRDSVQEPSLGGYETAGDEPAL
jgi:16S rRNA (guanine527-N7)-methyltransferase